MKSTKSIAQITPELILQNRQVWAFPQASDLSPRHLINYLKLIKSLEEDADQLQRYVLALDLREDDENYGLFSRIEEFPAVNELLKTLLF